MTSVNGMGVSGADETAIAADVRVPAARLVSDLAAWIIGADRPPIASRI